MRFAEPRLTDSFGNYALTRTLERLALAKARIEEIEPERDLYKHCSEKYAMDIVKDLAMK